MSIAPLSFPILYAHFISPIFIASFPLTHQTLPHLITSLEIIVLSLADAHYFINIVLFPFLPAPHLVLHAAQNLTCIANCVAIMFIG